MNFQGHCRDMLHEGLSSRQKCCLYNENMLPFYVLRYKAGITCSNVWPRFIQYLPGTQIRNSCYSRDFSYVPFDNKCWSWVLKLHWYGGILQSNTERKLKPRIIKTINFHDDKKQENKSWVKNDQNYSFKCVCPISAVGPLIS